jgi:hypothetical protein
MFQSVDELKSINRFVRVQSSSSEPPIHAALAVERGNKRGLDQNEVESLCEPDGTGANGSRLGFRGAFKY